MEPKISQHPNYLTFNQGEVSVQSMTDTKTLDVDSTVAQVEALAKAGCDLVRISIPSEKALSAFQKIVRKLREKKVSCKIAADTHYSPSLAIHACAFADKVRINPGNFLSAEELNWNEIDKKLSIYNRLKPLVEACKFYGTSLRIGLNQGSVYKGSTEVLTVDQLVEECVSYIIMLRSMNFHQVVASIKCSDPHNMIEANQKLNQKWSEYTWTYPLHLGVTEAGNGMEARVKSAYGIGTLLAQDIGQTIRVSLAESPVREVSMAHSIVAMSKREKGELNNLNLLAERVIKCSVKPTLFNKAMLIHDSAHRPQNAWKGDGEWSKFKDEFEVLRWQEDLNWPPTESSNPYILATFKELGQVFETFLQEQKRGPILLLHVLDDLSENQIAASTLQLTELLKLGLIQGIVAKSSTQEETDFHHSLLTEILQLSGQRNLKSTVVACPGCSRSSIDLERVTNLLKTTIGHHANYKLSVMGCSVNGYGEMLKSDLAVIGKSSGKMDIYHRQKLMHSNVAEGDLQTLVANLVTAKMEAHG